MPIASVVSGKFKKNKTKTPDAKQSEKKTWGKWLEKTNLKYKLKLMLLQFANSIQNENLRTFHFIVNFTTVEKKPTYYKLELLLKLRDEVELRCVETQINNQLNVFAGYRTEVKEIKTIAEETIIENNFKADYKNHTTMKFLLRHWVTDEYGRIKFVNDTTVGKQGNKDFRVNILKTGEMPFSMYQDLFVVEIDTTELKR